MSAPAPAELVADPSAAARDGIATPLPIASLLATPRFAFLVAGQTISQLGDKLHHMALIALVGAGAPASAGGLALAQLSVVFTAPVILAGPLAGALVDRWDKRRTMIACDAARTVLVAAIPAAFAATGRLWPVYALAALAFLLGVFFNAAKMALIPELVPRPGLLAANAALTGIGRVATVAGIVGGGLLIGLPAWRRLGWSDYAAGFYLDAASYLVSVVTLVAIARRRAATDDAPAPSAGPRGERATLRGALRSVVATRHLVHGDPALRFAFASLAVLALFASTVYVAMTWAVQSTFGRGPAGVGILGGTLAGGMVAGSLAVGAVGARWARRTIVLAGTTAIGLLLLVAAARFSFEAFLPVAALGGALLAPVMVAQDTLLHEHAPAGQRAVLFASRDLLLGGVFMTSALAVGGAVQVLGRLGVDQPYRMALAVVGLVLLAFGAAHARRPAP